MRVKIGMRAPDDERYAPGAFAANIGKPIRVNMGARGLKYPAAGVLVAAQVVDGGRGAELTIDIPATGRPCPPMPMRPLPDELLQTLDTAEVRAHLEGLNAALPLFARDDFARIAESFVDMLVCTSMTDEQVTAHAVRLPSGTSGGWRLDEQQPEPPAGRCPNLPATRRHLVLSAYIDWNHPATPQLDIDHHP